MSKPYYIFVIALLCYSSFLLSAEHDPLTKPLFITFPHHDIVALANSTTAALMKLPEKKCSIFLDNATIYHLTRHPHKPLIVLSTQQELAVYDVVQQKKIWQTDPLDKHADIVFNTNTQELIAYYAGKITLYNLVNNQKTIHEVPIKATDSIGLFCPITYNQARDEITYIDSAESLSCVSCKDFTKIKRKFAELQDWISVESHAWNARGDILAARCLIMGSYLYPAMRSAAQKIYLPPKQINVFSRAIAFHPIRDLLAVVDDCKTITYFNAKNGKTIAMTHPWGCLSSSIATLKPYNDYRIDFSPDGKKLAVLSPQLIFNVPGNNLIAVYVLLRDNLKDPKIIRYVFSKFARAYYQHYRLSKLSLMQLLQS